MKKEISMTRMTHIVHGAMGIKKESSMLITMTMKVKQLVTVDVSQNKHIVHGTMSHRTNIELYKRECQSRTRRELGGEPRERNIERGRARAGPILGSRVKEH